MPELRCSSRIHGVLTADGHLEVKCRSSKCGARRGVVVMHYFDLSNMELVETKKFKDPVLKFNTQQEEG